MSFHIDFSEQLIEQIRRYPRLYNTKLREYKDTVAKNNSWDTIARELSDDTHQYTSEQCQKHWRSLKDNFSAERKARSLPSGAGRSSKRKTSWPLYDMMLWMNDYISGRSTHSNASVAASQEREYEEAVASLDDERSASDFGGGDADSVVDVDRVDGRPTQPPPAGAPAEGSGCSTPDTSFLRQKILKTMPKKKSDMDAFERTVCMSLKEQPKSENELLGMQIAKILDRLTPYKSSFAKVKIQELLLQIEHGQQQQPFAQMLSNDQLNTYTGYSTTVVTTDESGGQFTDLANM